MVTLLSSCPVTLAHGFVKGLKSDQGVKFSQSCVVKYYYGTD